MQHNNVMLKGNGFYELGIQPSLNAFSFLLDRGYRLHPLYCRNRHPCELSYLPDGVLSFSGMQNLAFLLPPQNYLSIFAHINLLTTKIIHNNGK